MLFNGFVGLSQEYIINTDSIPVDSVLSKNYERFIGSKIKEFVIEDYVRLYEDYSFVDEPPGYFKGFKLIFGKGTYFLIRPKTSMFINRRRIEGCDWKFHKIIEEKIGSIAFYHRNEKLLLVPE